MRGIGATLLLFAMTFAPACAEDAEVGHGALGRVEIHRAASNGETSFVVLTPSWSFSRIDSASDSCTGGPDEIGVSWLVTDGGEVALRALVDGTTGTVRIDDVDFPLEGARVFALKRARRSDTEWITKVLRVKRGAASVRGMADEVALLLDDHPELVEFLCLKQPAPVAARWVGKADRGPLLMAGIEIESLSERPVRAVTFVLHGRDREGALVPRSGNTVVFPEGRELAPGTVHRDVTNRDPDAETGTLFITEVWFAEGEPKSWRAGE